MSAMLESTKEELDVRFEPPPVRLGGKFSISLSGGGYRAMLFHTGAIMRLIELGLFREGKLRRISSVSGGSILAGLLAQHWDSIKTGDVEAYRGEIVTRVLDVSSRLLDVRAVVGALLRGSQPAREIAALYEGKHWRGKNGRAHLFDPNRKLKDLPGDSSDARHRFEFVFNATDLNTGERWHFSRTEAGAQTLDVDGPDAARDSPDSKGKTSESTNKGSVHVHNKTYALSQAGKPGKETITIAEAVAASGAFPPILSPLLIDVERAKGHRTTHSLVDGGVYDNIGLDTLKPFDTLLVSDAGGVFDHAGFIGFSLLGLRIPAQLLRVFNVVDGRSRSQVRHWLWHVLRRSLDRADDKTDSEGRTVAYWTMDDSEMKRELALQDWRDQPKAGKPLPVPEDVIRVDDEMANRLARVSTRLAPMTAKLAQQIINLGYARCDWYLRTMAPKLILRDYPAPSLPYPDAALDQKPAQPPVARIKGTEIRLAYVAALAWLLVSLVMNAVFAGMVAWLIPGVAAATMASPGALTGLLFAILSAPIVVVVALAIVTVFVVWRGLCLPAKAIETVAVDPNNRRPPDGRKSVRSARPQGPSPVAKARRDRQ